jgi:hypothetical protein
MATVDRPHPEGLQRNAAIRAVATAGLALVAAALALVLALRPAVPVRPVAA